MRAKHREEAGLELEVEAGKRQKGREIDKGWRKGEKIGQVEERQNETRIFNELLDYAVSI